MGGPDPTYVAAGPGPPRLPGGALGRGCPAAAALPERCRPRLPPGASPLEVQRLLARQRLE